LKHAPPYPETTARLDPARELVRLRARLVVLSALYDEWLAREMKSRDEEGLIWLAVDAIERRWELGIKSLEEEIEKLHEQLREGDERI